MSSSENKTEKKLAEILEKGASNAAETVNDEAKNAAKELAASLNLETAEETEKPSEIDTLKEEVATLKDQVLRNHAELENTRRRARRDVEEAGKYAVTTFARDLINVLENLHRAEDNIPLDQIETNELLKNIFDGVEITKRELLNVFDRHGITRIDPKGQTFDHNFHQAMMHVEDAENPANTVVQVLQAGYMLKDRLLRPALVGVSKAPQAKPEAGKDD